LTLLHQAWYYDNRHYKEEEKGGNEEWKHFDRCAVLNSQKTRVADKAKNNLEIRLNKLQNELQNDATLTDNRFYSPQEVIKHPITKSNVTTAVLCQATSQPSKLQKRGEERH